MSRGRAFWVLVVVVAGLYLASGGNLGRSASTVAGAGSASSHTFLSVQADGATPVTYSSCVPIRIEVNTRTMPAEAEGVVEEAVATMSEITGLDLAVDGETTRPPGDLVHIWSPILIAWSDADEDPDLEGGVVGAGGSVSQGRGVNDAIEVYLTGQVTLDGPAMESILATRSDGREQVRATVLHELAHVLGLGHVEDRSQLMHPSSSVAVTPQAGDRAGLARLGQGPCIRAL